MLISLNDFTLMLANKKMLSLSIPTENHPESEFCVNNNLNEVLLEYAPNLYFVDYLNILSQMKSDTHLYDDIDAMDLNKSQEKHNYIPIDILYNELVSCGIFKYSKENIYYQKQGLNLEEFKDALIESLTNNGLDFNIIKNTLSVNRYELINILSKSNIDMDIREHCINKGIKITHPKFPETNKMINRFVMSMLDNRYQVRNKNLSDIVPYNNIDSKVQFDIDKAYFLFMDSYGFNYPSLEMNKPKNDNQYEF